MYFFLMDFYHGFLIFLFSYLLHFSISELSPLSNCGILMDTELKYLCPGKSYNKGVARRRKNICVQSKDIKWSSFEKACKVELAKTTQIVVYSPIVVTRFMVSSPICAGLHWVPIGVSALATWWTVKKRHPCFLW